jgi:hypothetical protein
VELDYCPSHKCLPQYDLADLLGHPQAVDGIKMINTTVALLGYRFAPVWLGRMGLRTFLKNVGVSPDIFPRPCMEAIAKDALSITEIQTIGKNVGFKVAAYTHALELRAWQMGQLFLNPNRGDMFLRDCIRLRDIIVAHGVPVPEIQVS